MSILDNGIEGMLAFACAIVIFLFVGPFLTGTLESYNLLGPSSFINDNFIYPAIVLGYLVPTIFIVFRLLKLREWIYSKLNII